MNPQLHDEFIALCALFYAGEISDEEWALLQVHLAYCESCRRTFEEYKEITKNVIPVMAASAAQGETAPVESQSSLDEAEQRLMTRLHVVPRPSEATEPRISTVGWWLPSGVIAACLLAAFAFAGLRLLKTGQLRRTPLTASAPTGITLPAKRDRTPNGPEQLELEQSRHQLVALQQRLAAAEIRVATTDESITSLRHQLQVEEAQSEQMASDRDALSKQLVLAQQSIQTLGAKLTSAAAGSGQQAQRVALLEAKVQLLSASLDDANAALSDKDRMLALDKDFLSHDRDIRDLIGARNLYIADIFDTNQNGKTAKPFGRIFYTKDRSLVFYGFDLEKQAGLKQDAAFQVWGSGSERRPVSLGLFYQDDGHKRWVLRCDDAKALARLNMVFVTVEPPGGSVKPTGKPLLRAYLQIASNHP